MLVTCFFINTISIRVGFLVIKKLSFTVKLDQVDEMSVVPQFKHADRNLDTRSFLRGIDVNRAPATVDCEEEGGVSSPNSTISSISGKRNERDPVGDETEAERASCSRASDDEDGGAGGDASRKKLRLSKEQSLLLEETFKEHSTLNPVSGIFPLFVLAFVRTVFQCGIDVKCGSCVSIYRSKSWHWQSN